DPSAGRNLGRGRLSEILGRQAEVGEYQAGGRGSGPRMDRILRQEHGAVDAGRRAQPVHIQTRDHVYRGGRGKAEVARRFPVLFTNFSRSRWRFLWANPRLNAFRGWFRRKSL